MDEPASKSRLADVHVATEEDISNGTYSIEDVVLPLPGTQIKYPAHSTAEVHRCLFLRPRGQNSSCFAGTLIVDKSPPTMPR